MKILHLSDLHIGNFISPPDEGDMAKELVDIIIKKWGDVDKDQKPIIVITGDTVDSGFEWEYKKANEILQKLKDNNFEVVPVPGNHDYGPKGNFVNAEESEKYYRKYIKDVSYPYDAIKNEDFTIIGLNSMEGETSLMDMWLADGQLGEDQLNELEEKLKEIKNANGSDHKIVLILHHHPFDLDNCSSYYQGWHCLKDGDKFMGVVAGKVDVILFGHEHCEGQWIDDYNIPLMYMSDKSTEQKPFSVGLISFENGKPIVEKEQLQ